MRLNKLESLLQFENKVDSLRFKVEGVSITVNFEWFAAIKADDSMDLLEMFINETIIVDSLEVTRIS